MNAFDNFTSGLATCIVAQNIQFQEQTLLPPCSLSYHCIAIHAFLCTQCCSSSNDYAVVQAP